MRITYKILLAMAAISVSFSSASAIPGRGPFGVAGALCKQTCTGNTLSLHFFHGGCPKGGQVKISCSPYICKSKGKNCAVECASSADCASGFFCNSSKCIPLSYTCVSDSQVQGTDGSLYSCNGYNCQAGRCKEACVFSTECQVGWVCNEGQCVQP